MSSVSLLRVSIVAEAACRERRRHAKHIPRLYDGRQTGNNNCIFMPVLSEARQLRD